MGRKIDSNRIERDPLRYLKRRKDRWHYVRRVPGHFSHLDGRGLIQVSLKTSSLDVAQMRRDALESADDLYWLGLVADDADAGASAQYDAARARARAIGFEYKGPAALAATASYEDILKRITLALDRPRDEDAVLGLIDMPRLTVKKAMELFITEIGIGETKGMSPHQKASWEKQKRAAVTQFCDVVGDKSLLDITRSDALAYYRWWQARVAGSEVVKAISGNTANRAFGNMRKLFREYTRHMAIEAKNPFADLSFSDPKSLQKKVLPFSAGYIEKVFLKSDALKGMNREARLVFLAMVETGCRPSEICNLRPEAIHLDAPVPYLSIVYQSDRKVKTENSVRDVPLVGVSLEAMKRAPKGFPRYVDKETNLSGAVMKYLKTNELLPSKNHRAYSLRHGYETRMLEGGMDDEFRRRLLGHDTDRPDYGDGGALKWRRDQMLKIVLPFDATILD